MTGKNIRTHGTLYGFVQPSKPGQGEGVIREGTQNPICQGLITSITEEDCNTNIPHGQPSVFVSTPLRDTGDHHAPRVSGPPIQIKDETYR